MSLMDHFPGTPRGDQEAIIDKIQDAFDSDKKFVICQAPTGSGKSFLGATACLSTSDTPRSMKQARVTPRSHFSREYSPDDKFGGFVLTTSKQLQDQYVGLFPDMTRMKGKNNYPCALNSLYHAGCANCCYIGPQMDKCSMNGDCEYINA